MQISPSQNRCQKNLNRTVVHQNNHFNSIKSGDVDVFKMGSFRNFHFFVRGAHLALSLELLWMLELGRLVLFRHSCRPHSAMTAWTNTVQPKYFPSRLFQFCPAPDTSAHEYPEAPLQ